MFFAGHSLGSGLVLLLTMISMKNNDKLGGITRNKIRCYAIAPASWVPHMDQYHRQIPYGALIN